ncbi:hypothetical protein AB0E04_39735 [Streptomyces sp. NPDC048251]|uniref:hypothetical protein n=1 Tax=Streptomyces sp. NPDC048251 TaxID=3154501 RepID=UPI00341D7C5D
MPSREERFAQITERHVSVYGHYRQMQGHPSENYNITKERLYLDFNGRDYNEVDKIVQSMTPTHINYARTLTAGKIPNDADSAYVTAYMIGKKALFEQVDALARQSPPVNFGSGRADVRAAAAAVRTSTGNLPPSVENAHSSVSASSAAQQQNASRPRAR